jgi:general secretion pathway protein K
MGERGDPVRRQPARAAVVAGEGRQRGVALVVVVWGLALVATAVAAIGFTTRSETLATRNAFEEARARLAAEAGVQLGLHRLLAAGSRRVELAAADPERLKFAGSSIAIAIADEEGKIDLNEAPLDLLLGLVAEGASNAPVEALPLACRIFGHRGWLDPRCGRVGAGWATGAFGAVEELRDVAGVDPKLYARLAPLVTVYSGAATIDPRVAPRGALLAVPALSTGFVDDWLARRHNGDDADRPRDRRWFTLSSGRTYTVSATAVTAGGGRHRDEMVVRLTGVRERPYVVLAWREPAVPAGIGASVAGAGAGQ